MAELPTLASPLLARAPGVRHAFFTRRGGVSKGMYASLNLGSGSGDDPTDVAENRARAAAWFGLEPHALLSCHQIHSARVHTASADWTRAEGDALVSARPGLVCGALAADCAPVLMADAEARVVAAVHAGWKGALAGVVEAATARMESLGARRDRIVAAIGPCIAPASYEVGLEFLHRFETQDPGAERFFTPGADASRRMFDLPAYVLDRLGRAGVTLAEWIGRDSYTEADLFYSNRRALHLGEADYGRLLSAITLV